MTALDVSLWRRRKIIESTGAVMAGLVPAIHVVQLKKWKRFATVLPWSLTKS